MAGACVALAAVDRLARHCHFSDYLAGGRTIRPMAQVGVEKIEPRRATEKSTDAAIEMHQVQHSAIPRDFGGAAEVLEVNEIHVEAARLVVLDHEVGLLQVARVKPGLVQAPDLRGHGVGNLFAAMHVASLDFVGAKHEAAQRIGVDERAADEIGRSNRARPVHVDRSERFRMREAVRFEHRGAGERSLSRAIR